MKPKKDPLVTAAELRSRAEAAFAAQVAAAPETQTAPTPETTRTLLHELQVHQIELEMQNEELRRTQGELEDSRASYFDLYDLAPVGYCTIDEKGLILQANLTLATLVGVARNELVRRPFSHFILQEDADIFYLLTKHILAAHPTGANPAASSCSCELRLKRGDGTPVWVGLTVTAATGESGETVLRVVVTDISARRAREVIELEKAEIQVAILNAIPAHVALIDPEGIILATNDSWRRFATANLLQGPEFALGQNYLKVCERATGPCSEEAKDAAVGIRRVLRGEAGEFSIEYPCHSPTEQRWFRLMATALHEGFRGGGVVMHLNITERKLAEVKLAQTAEMLERTGELAKIGGWSVDLPTMKLRWSRETFRISELETLEEPDLEGAINFYAPEARPVMLAAVQAAIATGTPYDLELPLITAKGNHRWVQSQGFADMQDGKAVRIYGTFQDITERKRADVALAKAEGSRLAVWQSSLDAIITMDELGNITDFNPAAEKMFGYPAADVVGQSLADKIIPPALREGHRRGMALLLATGQGPIMGRRIEISAMRSDGTEFPVELTVVSVAGAGHPLFLGTIRDITERRKLEDQLRHSQKMQAVGTLAAGIAHDFNNILAAILGNTELALGDTAPEHPARESLDEIKIASARAKGLVQQILAFSSQQPRERHPMALGPLVEEAARLLRATIPAAVQIVTSLEADVPPVIADATQVHQILINLCTNAWHALGDQAGRIEVKLRSVTLDAAAASRLVGVGPGRFACVSVSDNGKGMDAATIQRIFDPFFTTKEPGKGTGLGLSVVHGIIKGYQGAIEVDSQPGQGTTFTLYIPATVSAPGVSAPGVSASSSRRGESQRILYLDDDEAVLLAATRMLEHLGYHVTGFSRAADAVKAFRDNPGQFDLAITDLNVPGTTGLKVAIELLKVRADLPVVLVSGSIDEGLQRAAREAGIRGILGKPFTMAEFSGAIHRLATTIQQL